MKTLQRIYLKDFLRLFAILAAGLSVIFGLIDLVDKIDNFIPGKPSPATLALYTALNIPRFLVYILPMSVLICSLFTLGQAARRKELIAIKAAGGRMRRLLFSFVLAGVAINVFAFILAEMIVPDFSKRATEIRYSLEGTKKQMTFSEGSVWMKSKDGFPVKIDLYVPEKKIAQGITIFVTGDNILRERIIAETGYWDGSTWVLSQVTRYDFENGEIEKSASMNYPGLGAPDLITEGVKVTDNMGAFELHRYIKRIRESGFRDIKLVVNFHSRISFPMINIIMMVLGISLPVRFGLGSGMFSAGLGILISLTYWFSFTIALSMGYAGVLPPFVAAWSIPVIFGIFAVRLYRTIPE